MRHSDGQTGWGFRVGRSVGIASLLLLLAGGSWASAAETPGPLTLETRRLKMRGGPKVEAEFGRFTVPENRSRESSRSLELAFVRLKSRVENPAAPVVYLEGGPGGSSTWQAERPDWLSHWRALLEVADVILFDQRGTGASQPDMRWQWDGELPLQAFDDGEFTLRHSMEMGRRARAALIERGIDPDGYTTEESADDVDDLRRALGLERISLLGFSYGTHLGLSVLRRHGEHVENTILVGTEGPDHTLKLPMLADVQFRKLATLAARAPELEGRVPDLMGLLHRVLAKLEREPMPVTLQHPATGEPIEVPIGPFGLKFILRRDIGDASDLPVFPRLLWTIDQGDSSVLEWFVRKRARGALGVNGMSMLVDGASGISPGRLALVEDQARQSVFADVVNFPWPRGLEVWKPRDLGPGFREPLVTDARTLFVSGTLDWNTPPHQAEEVRWGFSNSSHIIVENGGHEQLLSHSEVKRAMQRFLRGEEVGDVHAAWPPLSFVPLEGRSSKVSHPSISGH